MLIYLALDHVFKIISWLVECLLLMNSAVVMATVLVVKVVVVCTWPLFHVEDYYCRV